MNANALIRWTTVAAVLAIASVAAGVSYEHALAVVRAYGETGAVGYAYPATIDGMIYVSSMAMLDSARRGLRTPALARWMLGTGIAATLVVNVLAGLHSGGMGSVIAAWPALALVGSYELLMAMIRREAVPGDVEAIKTVAATVPDAAPVNAPVATREEGTYSAPGTGMRTVAESAHGGARSGAPRGASRRGQRKRGPKRADRRGQVTAEDAEAAFADLLATGEVPSIRAIRRELPVGEPKAKLLRAHLENVTMRAAAVADAA